MPSNPVYVTLTSTGASRSVNLDISGGPTTVGVTFSTTSMTAQYGVQYTTDDAQYLEAIGSTRAVSWQTDSTFGTSAVAANTSTYSNPIAAVRVNLDAISSSSVILKVLQAG